MIPRVRPRTFSFLKQGPLAAFFDHEAVGVGSLEGAMLASRAMSAQRCGPGPRRRRALTTLGFRAWVHCLGVLSMTVVRAFGCVTSSTLGSCIWAPTSRV